MDAYNKLCQLKWMLCAEYRILKTWVYGIQNIRADTLWAEVQSITISSSTMWHCRTQMLSSTRNCSFLTWTRIFSPWVFEAFQWRIWLLSEQGFARMSPGPSLDFFFIQSENVIWKFSSMTRATTFGTEVTWESTNFPPILQRSCARYVEGGLTQFGQNLFFISYWMDS